MSHEENKSVVRRLYDEVFNSGMYAALDELLATDYVGYDPPDSPKPQYGAGAMRQGAERLALAFPDRCFTVEVLIAEGDMIAARVALRATHSGQFFDVAPTSRQIATTGTITYRFAGGKIVASWGNWDNLGLMRQLGLLAR